jgi:hypothetical protein
VKKANFFNKLHHHMMMRYPAPSSSCQSKPLFPLKSFKTQANDMNNDRSTISSPVTDIDMHQSLLKLVGVHATQTLEASQHVKILVQTVYCIESRFSTFSPEKNLCIVSSIHNYRKQCTKYKQKIYITRDFTTVRLLFFYIFFSVSLPEKGQAL